MEHNGKWNINKNQSTTLLPFALFAYFFLHSWNARNQRHQRRSLNSSLEDWLKNVKIYAHNVLHNKKKARYMFSRKGVSEEEEEKRAKHEAQSKAKIN